MRFGRDLGFVRRIGGGTCQLWRKNHARGRAEGGWREEKRSEAKRRQEKRERERERGRERGRERES